MSFTAFNKFIFRTPLLPFSTNLDPNGIIPLLDDFFLDAIFISSIDLFDSISKSDEHENLSTKINGAILKYLTRAKSRCTPFGLLAGVGIGDISNSGTTSIRLKNRDEFYRHTRLDVDYLGNIISSLNEDLEIRKLLKYYPNKTLYNLIDRYRYVETKIQYKKRTHLTSAIETSSYLETILKKASCGESISVLANTITDTDITFDEKCQFINELINEQVLVSNFEINVTGKEVHFNILELLESIKSDNTQSAPTDNFKSCISEIYFLIKQLDNNGITNSNLKTYSQILKKIELIGIPYNKKYLFQTDLIVKAHESQVSSSVIEDALKLIDVVSRLTPKSTKSDMSKFGERFYEKWEYSLVPLALALDPEYGISYPVDTNESFNINTFVDDLVLPSKGGEIYSQEYDPPLLKFWHKKYFTAISNNQKEIVITDKDIEPFLSRTNELPNTLGAMVKIIEVENKRDKKNTIYLKSAGGSTAANLIARFCHADGDIKAYCEEIIKKEIELNPDKIIAEIVHLPESRLGNILSRPKMYNYEICYLAKASVENEYQISISDLAIKLVDNKVALFSTKHNKQVIPRLTTAHNFKQGNLPIYQFLCDLQFQDTLSHVGIDLGKIDEFCNYIPRISYNGHLIIQLAKWQFSKEDFEEICSGSDELKIEKFNAFRKKWALPNLISLTEGDNELVIDTNNNPSILMMVNEIKGKEKIWISEFLFSESDNVITSVKGMHLNEILLAFYKTEAKKNRKQEFFQKREVIPKNDDFFIKRYYPNEKWLCLKLYIGNKSAEDLLVELDNLNETLIREGYIEKWFFIRYNDPQFHLRLRYLTGNPKKNHEILTRLNSTISKFLSSDAVWRYQIDTYTPEIERYGLETIELAESLFYEDSQTIIKLMAIENNDDHIKRWLIGLKNIDMYFNLFEYDLSAKIEFTENLKNHFSEEFYSNKHLKKQIDKKFTDHRKDIENWLFLNSEDERLYNINSEMLTREQKLKPQVTCLLKSYNRNIINKWLTSYIHMSTNRLVSSKSRLHEFIFYELLNRAYLSYSWKLKSKKQ